MSGSPKENLQTRGAEEVGEEREVYLRDGRRLVVSEAGADQLVEVRNASGMLEVRIRLTDQGPVLQLEGARLALRAAEAVEIESERVAIKAGQVRVESERDIRIEGKEEVVVVGLPIHLNPDT